MEASFNEVTSRAVKMVAEAVDNYQEFRERNRVDELFTKIRVIFETDNRLLGGWPKDAKMELAMLEARYRAGTVKAETVAAAKERVAAASSKDPIEETEKAVDKAATGFKKDDIGIYIESRQIKAGIKECCSAMKFTSNRQTKQEVQHGLFARSLEENPDVIHFIRDSDILKESQGYEQLIAHVETRQGPRSTIKYHDFVEPGTRFGVEIWYIAPKDSQINEQFIASFLELAQHNGFGCSRSQGFGRLKVINVEKIAEGSIMKVLNKKERDKLSKEREKIAKEESKRTKEAKAKATKAD